MVANEPEPEHMTPREFAARFLAWLERRDWTISLDDHGRMHAVIGESTEKMPQAVILAVLGAFEHDVIAILHGLNQVH